MEVFTASAGVILLEGWNYHWGTGFPRIRGGDPRQNKL